jgi:hypothetical protein
VSVADGSGWGRARPQETLDRQRQGQGGVGASGGGAAAAAAAADEEEVEEAKAQMRPPEYSLYGLCCAVVMAEANGRGEDGGGGRAGVSRDAGGGGGDPGWPGLEEVVAALGQRRLTPQQRGGAEGLVKVRGCVRG